MISHCNGFCCWGLHVLHKLSGRKGTARLLCHKIKERFWFYFSWKMFCSRMVPAAWHRGRSYCKIHMLLLISWYYGAVVPKKCDILAKSGQLSGLPWFLRGGCTPTLTGVWMVDHGGIEFRGTLGEAQAGVVPLGAMLAQLKTQILLEMWCLCLAVLSSSSLSNLISHLPLKVFIWTLANT